MPESVQSVERAFRILFAFDEENASLSAAELARVTGLARPTTYRLLQTLQNVGLVRNSGGSYELTPLVLRLGSGFLGSHGLARRSQPVLDRLTETVGEHSAIAVLDGDDIVSVASSNSPHSRHLAVAVQVGQRLPARLTSLGRVLLAFSPSHITGNSLPLGDEEQIRNQGYALSDGLLDPDLRSLAVPIRDRGGNVVAAVAVAVSTRDATADQLESDFLPRLRSAATELTQMS